ncbi:MAG TPA: chromate transporter [Vicinamibacterales bacterium]|nr:chromate transporter [Vicinamibacterales bacterium]
MTAPPTLGALGLYFLRLGAVGFGGPAALTDRMRQDLVENRRWVSRAEFELGLTIAAACPGPLAYQLAVYCGVARHGTSAPAWRSASRPA